MELRCANRLHGIATDAIGSLEVVCRSALCGKRSGVVIVHVFDLETGKCETRKYKELPIRKDVTNSALG